jgi:hypothetical protein
MINDLETVGMLKTYSALRLPLSNIVALAMKREIDRIGKQ